MTILVLGGTGFIGRHVVRYLVDRGNSVTVFHRGETEADIPSTVKHLRGDRNELPSFVDSIRRLAPEVVLDMIPYTERDAVAALETFTHIARRLVAISSGDVYRNYSRLRRVEDGEPDP